MVELRDQHLVARVQGPPDRRAQRKTKRRHALAERNAIAGGRAEKRGHDRARMQHAAIDFARRREVAVSVHVACRVELADRLDHRGRDLAAARTIQVCKLRPLPESRERRKILPAAQRVLGGERHYSKSYVKSITSPCECSFKLPLAPAYLPVPPVTGQSESPASEYGPSVVI